MRSGNSKKIQEVGARGYRAIYISPALSERFGWRVLNVGRTMRIFAICAKNDRCTTESLLTKDFRVNASSLAAVLAHWI